MNDDGELWMIMVNCGCWEIVDDGGGGGGGLWMMINCG